MQKQQNSPELNGQEGISASLNLLDCNDISFLSCFNHGFFLFSPLKTCKIHPPKRKFRKFYSRKT